LVILVYLDKVERWTLHCTAIFFCEKSLQFGLSVTILTALNVTSGGVSPHGLRVIYKGELTPQITINFFTKSLTVFY